MANRHKIESYGYCEKMLEEHDLELVRHIEKDYYDEDVERVINLYLDNPIQAWMILKDLDKPNIKKQNEVLDAFSKGKSKIAMIIGARGSGKTATGFWISENLYNFDKMPVYYVGEGINKKVIPEWCHVVGKMKDVPEGCLAIVDEAALQYAARESWRVNSIMLGKQLATARHHGISVLFITQHSRLADINIRRLTDCFLWKISNSYELTLGIDTTKDKFWNFVRNHLRPRAKNECLFEYPAKHLFIKFTHKLPDCWSDELSRSWKDWRRIQGYGQKKDKKVERVSEEL